MITYWGEDGPEVVECMNEDCEREFYVKESVHRTYESGKAYEEARDA